MSLDWKITDCANPDELQSGTEGQITHAIIWACLAIDVGTISAKTETTFIARLKIAQAVYGPLGPNGQPLTAADVMRRRGLTTNVFPQSTDASFAKKMLHIATEQSAREIAQLQDEHSARKTAPAQ